MTDTKTPLEALEATIADFKAHPEMRIHTELARDAEGNAIDPRDPAATCFCAVGRYAFHRNVDPEPLRRHSRPREDGYYQLVEKDGLALHSYDIWNKNDADSTPEGKEILPVLEGIAERLRAGTPLEPDFA